MYVHIIKCASTVSSKQAAFYHGVGKSIEEDGGREVLSLLRFSRTDKLVSEFLDFLKKKP